MRRCFLWLLSVVLVAPGEVAYAEEQTPSRLNAAMLQLVGGQHVGGQLVDCEGAGIVRWQGADFVQPFDFAFGMVSAVQFPSPEKRRVPEGEYCLELEGGDVLFGTLLGVSTQQVELETSAFGGLHLQRSAVRRIRHRDAGEETVYVGPNGLAEWRESSGQGAWRQEFGQVLTDQKGASLVGDFGIPAQACVEFELSWTLKPNFLFALGCDQNGEQAFRVEVWGDKLVLLRETKDEADVVLLQELPCGVGRCHFFVYLDQQRNRAVVMSADGRFLGSLQVSGAGAQPGQSLRLVNHRGSIWLERLRITRWNGESPRECRSKAGLERTDGSTVDGEVVGFDAVGKVFLMAEEGGQTRVPADAVSSIVLSPSKDQLVGEVRAVLQDGTRLSGKLQKVDSGRVWLTCASVVEPIGARLSDLQALVVLQNQKSPSEPSGRRGRLETDGVRLSGWLEEGAEQPEASCLVWHPEGSRTASPLKHGVSGRIVYRDPAPQASAEGSSPSRPVALRVGQPAGVRVGRVIGQVVQAVQGNATKPASAPPTRRSSPTLYLRTGDTIPCQVERIDERGVTFHSPLFEVTAVTHDKIRAVELENPDRAVRIDSVKRDRLLTLPRMQKSDPPSHLIRSTEGDYLRARLIELDEKTATVEVHLETRRLPREDITRIIWLDPSTEEPPKETPASTENAAAARVQAIRADGIRLTFLAAKLSGAALEGTSTVLGACHVAVSEVDQLLIGDAIEQATQTLPYQRWRLQPAVEPKFVQEKDDPGSSEAESALVGKPAPDFELETLEGGRFRLSEQRGKIVVLDFWATWCGACIETLPHVVEAVKQCDRDKVVLVAVNLQESPEAITALLRRLKLETTVALDQEGIVAQQYAALAIPETVIIDARGNVARVLVGGGPQAANSMRDTLGKLLRGESGQEAAQGAPPSGSK